MCLLRKQNENVKQTPTQCVIASECLPVKQILIIKWKINFIDNLFEEYTYLLRKQLRK